MEVIFVSQQKLLSMRSNLVVYFVVFCFFVFFWSFTYNIYKKYITEGFWHFMIVVKFSFFAVLGKGL